MWTRERERQIGKGKRDGREERETDFFFILFVGVVYIILINCM